MYTDIHDDEYFLSDCTDSEDYEYYLRKFEETESDDYECCFQKFEESEALPVVESNTAACENRKLIPKIMISRVPEDVKEEDVIENIKNKNPWLRYLIKDEDDFKKVATVQADAKGRPGYIIKCSPQIRRNVAARGDKLYILDKFGDEKFCKVYDRYHVIRCTKCQKFGHKLGQCRGELVCPKCGKGHWLRDCNSETSTCFLCKGPHITGNRSCQKYKEQEARIKDRTDHGEHLEVIMLDLQSEGAERKNITTKQQKTIKQEAQRKKKEENIQVNVKSNKKLNKAKCKNATDHGEQQVVPVVESAEQKQKTLLTVENKKVEEARTKNTTAPGKQDIIPVVKIKKKKQRKQLTAEWWLDFCRRYHACIHPSIENNSKVEAGIKIQLTMENNKMCL
ncbi:uncharacterized protein [Macrobrachium rosenbergii]|uniref:uncharacterized protein n=1 Tax=Macrobrachium rosenbergii TaxID=79674 RepID=UPI0034D3A78B